MFAISAIAKGVIWAAAIEPVIQMLGLGSVFAAWNIAKQPKTFDDYIIQVGRSNIEPEEEPIDPHI